MLSKMDILKASAGVPFINQPFQIKSYSMTVTGVCGCEAATPMQLVSVFSPRGVQAVTSVCPHCHKSYRLLSFGSNAQGEAILNVDITAPQLDS